MLIIFLVFLPSLLASDCSSTRDPGRPCSTATAGRKFFFDSKHKVCQPFQYLGCGGNENKFDTAQQCKDTCVNGGNVASSTRSTSTGNSASDIPEFVPMGTSHDQWRKADLCGSNYLIPNGQYIKCGSGCPENHQCTNGVCCPSKDYVCSLRDDTGSFKEGVEDRPRFGWSDSVNSCVRFSYYGANGNYNNFPNFYSCLNYCKDRKKSQ